MAYADVVLDALGDPTRRAIFGRMRAGPLSVGELAAGLEVSRPAVSQHLAVLKAAGPATVRAAWTGRPFSVDRRCSEATRRWTVGLWGQTPVSFKPAARREAVNNGTR